jgi:TonB family protein
LNPLLQKGGGMKIGLRTQLILLPLLILWSAPVASAQQPASPAPVQVAPGPQPAVPQDSDTGLTPPQLLPLTRNLQPADACKNKQSGVVQLSLEVELHGLPDHVAADNAQGSALEKLAVHVVEEETFKPAMKDGKPITSNWVLLVSIEGCYVTKTGTAGDSTDVFRLTAIPGQTFVKPSPPKPATPFVPLSQLDTPGLERIGHGVSAPYPLNNVEAEFSEEARRKGISGVVLVTLIVGTDGRPQNPRIVHALGYGLDQKAIEAVKKYHFKPAMKDKVPVPVLITVAVNFRL